MQGGRRAWSRPKAESAQIEKRKSEWRLFIRGRALASRFARHTATGRGCTGRTARRAAIGSHIAERTITQAEIRAVARAFLISATPIVARACPVIVRITRTNFVGTAHPKKGRRSTKQQGANNTSGHHEGANFPQTKTKVKCNKRRPQH